MDINSAIRTAAVLYADDNQNTTQKTITRKIVESVFLRVENRELSIHQIIEEIHTDLNLEFAEDEIKKIINTSDKFEVRQDAQTNEAYIKLKSTRFSNLEEKVKTASIQTYINMFTKKIYKGSLTEDTVTNCIFHFIYELLNKNISTFKKLIRSQVKADDISINVDSFDLEERICINEFLNWNNLEKNKALFDVVSYAIEYSLITNNVAGGNIFSEHIKNKVFYLDINVIYRAIGINGEERKKRTLSFLNKCKNTGQTFFISKYSIDEFRASVLHHITQLQKVSFNKINPKLFSDYAVNTSFYEFYHLWRMNRSGSYNFDLFHAHILTLYKSFLAEFHVQEDYKIPFNENDRKVEKIIDVYTEEIRVFKGVADKTAKFDALNVYLIEKRRDTNARTITDTKYFFVSVDQKLRSWDFQRNDLQPIALLPSQWMSILLKYFSRTNDDYKSFVSFLQLRLQEPVIQEEQMHFILSGVSELTEDFNLQREIFDTMIELKFQKAIDDKSADEVREESIKFAQSVIDDKLKRLKSEHEQDKKELKKSIVTDKLAFKQQLLNEQESSLRGLTNLQAPIESAINEKVTSRKLLMVLIVFVYFLIILSLIGWFGWNVMEQWTYILSIIGVFASFLYLMIKGESFDPQVYFANLRKKYRLEVYQKYEYDEARIDFLYKSISQLKDEINQLEK